MQNIQFIRNNAATHFGIDAEDFQLIAQPDEVCQQCWPIWLAFREGQAIGWWDESADLGCVL